MALFSASDPGEYRIVETKGPEGYDTIPGNYMFTIDKYGEIHYDGNNVETADQWTLTHENHLKPFDLTVHKKKTMEKHYLEQNFVYKEKVWISNCQKMDNQQTPSYSKSTARYVYLTETYTPEGYQGLKQSVKVVIQEDGTVMIDGTAVKNVLVDGEQHNQISLDVTNQAKVPLPETGGSGRLGIYLIGLIALGLSGVHLFMRNHRKGRDEMKKLKWLVLCLIPFCLFSFPKENQAQSETRTVQFTLHKLLFENGKLPETQLNTGQEQTFLQKLSRIE